MQSLALLLIGALTLLPANTASAQSAPANRATLQEAVASPATITRIRERGDMLIVGVLYDYAPFSAFDASGNAIGFEVDLARALAEEWGIAVTFVPVAPSTRMQSLLGGQIDLIAAALPQTLANEAAVDFSTTYFYDTNALLLPATSQITSFQALTGKTIAAIQGDQGIARLDAHLANLGVNVVTLPFQEPAPALLALKAGQADALLGDSTYLSFIAQQRLELSVILPLPGENRFGFGLLPGDSFFRNLVNATLQKLYVNGTYNTIYQKWFGLDETVASIDTDGVGVTIPQLPTLPGAWPFTFSTMPTPASLPLASQLATVRARGTLLAGVPYDMAPFGYLDASGTLTGFDVAIAREFARRWLGDADAIELVRVTPDTAVPLLKAGQVDLLAAALPHTWPDSAEIDFSSTYYLDELGVLVREDSGIVSIGALAGRTVATVAGLDDWNASAQRFNTEFAIQPTILPFQEYRMAEQALLAGQIDAMIGSTTVLSHTVSLYPNLRLLPDILTPEPHGIGLRHYDPELRDLIDLTLQVMKLDGTYDRIYRQWFADEPDAITLWLNPATLAQLRLAEDNDRTPALALLVPPTVPTETASPTASPMPIPLQLNTPAIALSGSSNSTEVDPTPTALFTAPATTATPQTDATATNTTRIATPTARATRVPPRPTATHTTQPPRLILLPTAALAVAPANRTETPTRLPQPTVAADLTTTVVFTDTSLAIPPLLAISTMEVDPVTESTSGGTLGTDASPTVITQANAAITTSLPLTVTVLGNVNINARTQPTTDAPILMLVAGGTSWAGLTLSTDGEWVQIALPNGRRGWVARRFLVESERLSAITTEATAVSDDIASAIVPSSTPTIAIELPTAELTSTITANTTESTATPATTPTPRLLFSSATVHRIRATDSLASIAQEYYGQQSLWQLIYEANREAIGDNPNVIPVGVELVIPPAPNR